MSDMDESTAGRGSGGELAAEESPLARWALLEGNRHHVAAVVLAGFLLFLGALLLSGIVAVQNDTALTRLFTAFVAGNLTLVTVAISINQLILSRELGTPDEFRDRIEEVIRYRHEVESAAEAAVSPITPEEYLDFLARQIRTHAERFREQTRGVDQRCRSEAANYSETLVAQSEQISAALETRPSSAFHTLLTILDVDFTTDLYRTERLRSAHADSLPAAATDTLDDIYELLEYTGVARQYFKTLYVQRELALLSRKLLYTGLPAVAVSVLAVWVYGHPTGAALDGPTLQILVLGATTVALAPLAILVAYILRVTAIARRTATLMPFEISERSPL